MIYYGTDVAMGINAMYFYCGIVATLIVEYIVLGIVAMVMRRRIKRMKKGLESEAKEDG